MSITGTDRQNLTHHYAERKMQRENSTSARLPGQVRSVLPSHDRGAVPALACGIAFPDIRSSAPPVVNFYAEIFRVASRNFTEQNAYRLVYLCIGAKRLRATRISENRCNALFSGRLKFASDRRKSKRAL